MRVAVVGSGIAGLSAAWLLSRQHEVVLFEAEARLGGHTHTHEVEQAGVRYRVDTGFIVHNPHNYPLLTRLFDELGVASQDTTMSFGVQVEATGLEYNATRLDTLFCQRRNLFLPRFLGMVRDILRFYREAGALLREPGPGPSLGEYLEQNRYSALFREAHLVPMASALWSSPSAKILEFPAKYLVRFMDHHRMLQVEGRPQWKVVKGGSSTYVEAMKARWTVETRLACPVQRVTRDEEGVRVKHVAGEDRFDAIVIATHSDQALALLGDADALEREVLGAIPYQRNEVVLHTDRRMLPRHRKAWAAWNAFVPAAPGAECSVSYCMNLLQGLDSPEPFVVTLNRSAAIDPSRVLARMVYHHPVYTHASVAAQARVGELNGRRHTWFAGAWQGFGFHEDGMRAGVAAATGLGVVW
ncbi:NAD(P)/FAD-dependent oxidoreductase [Silanimonas lenta]|uniref:NAD(P)/FAD-dependent oxidoreductase n=1 Tax=Silanimonas lenta TaxID=265429 RepID=UPI00041862D3|nr:FAD-dependent oxidoreductase [Silanimonas lenta]